MPRRGHAAVVELEDQEAAAREQAVERRDVLPGVGDGLGVRPAVDADDHRVAPRGVEGRGLEQRAVERRAVRGLELDPLEAAALVGQDLGLALSSSTKPPRAVLARHHQRAAASSTSRPGVGVEASVGRDQRCDGCRPRLREPHAARAVEPDAVQVALARILLGRGEVDEAGALVEQQARTGAGERRLRPSTIQRALGHGAAGARELAEVDVGEAVALGHPEEAAAVFQEAAAPRRC